MASIAFTSAVMRIDPGSNFKLTAETSIRAPTALLAASAMAWRNAARCTSLTDDTDPDAISAITTLYVDCCQWLR